MAQFFSFSRLECVFIAATYQTMHVDSNLDSLILETGFTLCALK